MRRSFRVVLFASLAFVFAPGGRFLLAQDDAKPSGNSVIRGIRGLEHRIDDGATVLKDALESVMFYEIVGRQENVVTADSVPASAENLEPLLDELRRQGVDVDNVNLELSLPHGAIGEAEQWRLQADLTRTYNVMQSRKVDVVVRNADDADSTIRLTAVRKGVPIVVLWLVCGAVFFTLRMSFINIRGFKHAVLVTMGRYDRPDDPGEVNHFQALSAALSATVGLGNIAGVAIAVMVGGPGAVFWMILAGFIGMTSKFTECTLGQMYREVRPDGRIMGGAMHYLSWGLAAQNLGKLGRGLAWLFAILCVGASFGGGNAFQVNQSLNAVQEQIPFLKDFRWVYGLVMAFCVGIVILGGIRRIAATAERIVPLMCCLYVAACLWIVLKNAASVPAALATIWEGVFTPRAGYGGLIGVLVTGFRRAAFSNEAGVGSAAIAHSSARTEFPVREGIVALLEPFIDTVVVCTMTGLVIVISGAYRDPSYAHFVADKNGAGLTSAAMGQQVSWFPYVLSASVILFAYSTMISWSYYGERCWAWMFGDRSSHLYRWLFLLFVLLGAVVSSTNVLDLSDLMILGMAFPNILGVVLLSGAVKRQLDSYWGQYKSGELEVDRSSGET